MAIEVYTTTKATQAGTPPVPQVSIGVPVYNGEPFIREALDSLLAQTFTDFELIISDNASTDRTEAICREYAAKDERIRYVRQAEHCGAMANFQFVLDEAVGEYFMWAAADDIFYEIHLNRMVQLLTDSNCTLVASRPEHMELSTRKPFQMREIPKGTFTKSKQKDFIALMRLHHWHYAKACLLYGLYRRAEMHRISDLPFGKSMLDVGVDLLYLYQTIASGGLVYSNEITWRRGERFFCDISRTDDSRRKIEKSAVRQLVFHVVKIFKGLDCTGRAHAIDRYLLELSKIYDSAFGNLDAEFKSALKQNKRQIISLLMPTTPWIAGRP